MQSVKRETQKFLVFSYGFAFFVLSFVLPSCERCSPGGSSTSVIVEPVKIQESSPTVIVPGVLIPRDRVEIKAEHPARVAEVLVNKGDIITEGTVLAKFSEEEINLKLNQLKNAKKEAEASLEKNQYLFKNRDKLLEDVKIDRTQYDGLAIELAASETALERIKADISLAEYNAARMQITSPINGIIVEKYATPMQIAAENQTLFIIVNIDPILVSFSLTADESSGIKIGTPITVKIEDLGGEKFDGQVTFIGPDIQQPGKTFDVWAAISNPTSVLKSGMYATTEFTSTNIHKIIAIPASAIITRDRDKFVFTVNNGAARQTKVSVRNIHHGIAEISNGLAENDLVVVKGAQGLQDGAQLEMWRR